MSRTDWLARITQSANHFATKTRTSLQNFYDHANQWNPWIQGSAVTLLATTAATLTNFTEANPGITACIGVFAINLALLNIRGKKDIPKALVLSSVSAGLSIAMKYMVEAASNGETIFDFGNIASAAVFWSIFLSTAWREMGREKEIYFPISYFVLNAWLNMLVLFIPTLITLFHIFSETHGFPGEQNISAYFGYFLLPSIAMFIPASTCYKKKCCLNTMKEFTKFRSAFDEVFYAAKFVIPVGNFLNFLIQHYHFSDSILPYAIIPGILSVLRPSLPIRQHNFPEHYLAIKKMTEIDSDQLKKASRGALEELQDALDEINNGISGLTFFILIASLSFITCAGCWWPRQGKDYLPCYYFPAALIEYLRGDPNTHWAFDILGQYGKNESDDPISKMKKTHIAKLYLKALYKAATTIASNMGAVSNILSLYIVLFTGMKNPFNISYQSAMTVGILSVLSSLHTSMPKETPHHGIKRFTKLFYFLDLFIETANLTATCAAYFIIAKEGIPTNGQQTDFSRIIMGIFMGITLTLVLFYYHVRHCFDYMDISFTGFKEAERIVLWKPFSRRKPETEMKETDFTEVSGDLQRPLLQTQQG